MDPSNAQDASQLTDDQFLNWGANNGIASYSDPSAGYASSIYPVSTGGQVQHLGSMHQGAVSNQLVRRNGNQQLARGSMHDVVKQDMWPGLGDGGQAEWEHVEDDEVLEQRAAAAKREAQAKRPPKQIPPFIQKLSSFLDASNTDLIKWSEDGNSFIVLDEDEFAKKLIPELFKHNNYASFVRQLNMYGFHKKVGLSDNSMRASEKKAKSPSEYYNPYFKRGRPELLWLIQKPKNETASNKRKRGKHADQDQGSDDEAKREGDLDNSHFSDVRAQPNDLVTLPRPEYAALKQEVMALQRSQKQIAQVLSRMRNENQQYYQQAKAFQAQSERQENSINAILTFLATFYNRSLDGHGNMGSMFSHAIPNSQTQGNVVDVGDYDAQNSSRPRPPRRPLALLPAPASTERLSPRLSPASAADSPRAWTTEQRRTHPLQNQQNISGNSSKIRSTNSSTRSSPIPEINASRSPVNLNTPSDLDSANNNKDMMSVIHNVNANSNTASDSKLDFNAALRHYENSSGQGPLTPEQRDNILHAMGNNVGLNSPTTGGTSTSLQPAATSSHALISPTPPLPPSLDSLHATREQLDQLHRQMQEQESKVQDLASRLQPLSPSGSIPGLPPSYYNISSNGGEPSAFSLSGGGGGDDFDVGNYLNSDYFPDYDALGAADFGADMNFDLPGEHDGDDEHGGGGGDADYFGSAAPGNGAGAGAGADGLLEPDAHTHGGRGGGRVVGSVGTSSGVHSPANVATVDDDENEDDDEDQDEAGDEDEVDDEDEDEDEDEAGSETASKRRKLRR